MKASAILPAALLVSACVGGGTPTGGSEILTFMSRDSGIVGSFDPANYTRAAVEKQVGLEACSSGRLAAYQQAPMEGGRLEFQATCAGPNKYSGTAGFTLNAGANSGHVTASVDGKLIQEKL